MHNITSHGRRELGLQRQSASLFHKNSSLASFLHAPWHSESAPIPKAPNRFSTTILMAFIDLSRGIRLLAAFKSLSKSLLLSNWRLKRQIALQHIGGHPKA